MLRAIAIAATVLSALPAAGQESVDPSTIGPTAARTVWCATAFGVAAANATDAGDGVAAISLRDSMTVLFQQLLLETQAAGVSRAQYDALTAETLRQVLDPFRDPASGFSRAECENAAAEATAFLSEVVVPEGG
jgi:predicted phage gp36 major capsid-like protein